MQNPGIRLAASAALVAYLVGTGCTAKPPISEGRRGGASISRFVQAISPSALAQTSAPPSLKKGFVDNIDRLTVSNENYRRVLYTGQHLQLVLMALKPGEEIGEEVHKGDDQFFRIEAGEGEVVVNGVKHRVSAGFAILVPAGARHNIRNMGTKPLKLYTLYAPPVHRHDVVQRSKAVAEGQHEQFDGKTSE
ncbi:MAG TPA: cupin domain-containing protein [Pantanalinema sp.]